MLNRIPTQTSPQISPAQHTAPARASAQSGIQYSTAKSSDANTAYDMCARAFAPNFAWNRPDMTGALQRPKTAWPAIKATTLDGTLVGVAVGMAPEGKSTKGTVVCLGVDPAFQGAGIGETLLRKVIQDLRTRGAKDVELQVEPDKKSAQRLYGRMGFEPTHTVPWYYGPGRDAIFMTLSAEKCP